MARPDSRRLVRVSSFLLVGCALLSTPLPVAADTVYVDCRPDNPSGSAFPSITAAINSLTDLPPTGDPWHHVLLRSDCTENVTINRSHIYIAPEWDSCPWSACQPTGPMAPARIIAADPGAAVVTVSGPVDVSLVHLSLSGGSRGLAMDGNAFVTTYGVIAEQNGDVGIDVTGGSSLAMNEGGTRNNGGDGLVITRGGNANLFGAADWLRNTPLVISGNGRVGVRMDRSQLWVISGVVIEGNQGWGLLTYGGDTSFGGCCGPESVVRDNAGGAFLTEGSEASFWGRTSFRENGPFGVWVEAGSHATFYESGGGQSSHVTVEGHQEIGVNVTSGSQASFHGANKIRNNGVASTPWSAGLRVDGRSSAFFDQGPGSGPTEISGNVGAGILLDLGAGLDAPQVMVRNNRQFGVRILHQSIALLGAGAGLPGNSSGPVACDATSLVVSNVVRRGSACPNVERPSEARPERPEPQP
jgi:hypothetical protein